MKLVSPIVYDRKYIEPAAKAEATMAEVLEAVELGIEMGGDPATVSSRFALEFMEAIFKPKQKNKI